MLRQIFIVSAINFKSLKQRLWRSLVIVVGMACVIGVLLSMLSLTEGMLAEAQWGEIAALVVGQWKWSLRLFTVDRHVGAETMIREKVAHFWKHYLNTGLQPPIDPERDEDLLKALHPKDDGSEIDLSGDNELPGVVDQLVGARAAKKDIETREKTAKTIIGDKMGAASFARIADGRRISNKTIFRKGFVVDATEFRMMKVLNSTF
jgi:hypothetical protein